MLFKSVFNKTCLDCVFHSFSTHQKGQKIGVKKRSEIDFRYIFWLPKWSEFSDFSQGSMPQPPYILSFYRVCMNIPLKSPSHTTGPAGPVAYSSIFQVTTLGCTNSTVAPPKSKSHHATGFRTSTKTYPAPSGIAYN